MEDVQHVLQHGLLNWKLSKFGGKPSPVYVLEGPGAPTNQGTGEAEVVPASVSTAPAGGQATFAGMPGSDPAEPASSRMASSAIVEEEAGLAAAPAAAGAGAVASEARASLAASSPQPARQLRVPFAANGGSTVALTIIDLQLDGS